MAKEGQQTEDEPENINTGRFQGEERTDFGDMTTEDLLDNL